ncbi:hypothetical protein [Streptomyces sp. LaPpAH-108]|uniref:hypothetical protein n=1 Tax=Streptomyces sp. LaPpAH-108 TaxID=1155714 RepID=UPI00036328CF|nr:hypothetical protein [Streptomyces sp. LaPpAH-108]
MRDGAHRQGSDRRPPGEVHWFRLDDRDDDCPWCRVLLLPGHGWDVGPPPPAPHPGCRRCGLTRLAELVRLVMVPFASLVTVVAALATAFRF